ncbi:MAG: hypothetical protein NWE96_09140 [Candidatus Bathyarchaeota archaeon]|nr:hypothetical protein [Candidatus Bathyarchaeota archaeon]
MSKRVVVEVRADLHKQLRKIAVINDLKLYAVTNALLEDCLSDEERVQAALKRVET